jgi:hypothetical protein
MPKRGQHNNDSDDKDKSKGHNNPDKSVDVNMGTPKKQETYKQQAARHQATDRLGAPARNDWDEDTRLEPSVEGSTRARRGDLDSGRSGSDSNASKGTEG